MLEVLGRPRDADPRRQDARARRGGDAARRSSSALPLAWLVIAHRPARRGARSRSRAPLPLVIPSYVAALALLGAFGPRGLLQQLLEPLGVERLPEIYGFVGAWLALTLSTYPYVFLLAGAALRGARPRARGRGARARALALGRLPARDAAGASPVARRGVAARRALHALRLRRGLADAVRRADAVDLPPVPLAVRPDAGRGARARARRARGRAARARGALAASRARVRRAAPSGRRRRSRSERWRWPAFAFCAAVVAFFLVVPLAVLVYWTARGVELGRGLDIAWEAALSSVSASALAAVVAVVAVLPVALLAERYPARWTRALERLAYTGNALPGIVIALSLVFFAANYADAALPDARAARVRVRRALLPAGARGRRVGAAGGAPADRGGRAEPRARPAARARDRHRAADPPRAARRRRARLPERDEGAPRDAAAAPDRLRDAGDRDLEVHRPRLVLAGRAARARC